MKKSISKKSGHVYAELLCDFMFKRLFGSDENKDVLRFVFLELGRFKKRIWEVESDYDKWKDARKGVWRL